MPEVSRDPEPQWEQIRPLIDDAMQELDEGDRQSVLLRFFRQQSFVAIGEQLGLSENAAQKRVSRALDRLSTVLAQRGITSTSAALAIALSQPGVAAPLLLAKSATIAALANVAGVSVGPTVFLTSMNALKLFTALAAGVALGVTAGLRSATNTATQQAKQRETEVAAQLSALQERVRTEAKRADAAEADTAKLLAAIEQARATRAAAEVATPAPVPASAPVRQAYVVRPGDTAAKIARSLGVSVEALQGENPTVNFARLMVGAQVAVPAGGMIPQATSVSAPPASATAIPDDAAYVLQPGDTLAKIAEKRGLATEQLQSLNPGVDWMRLKVGQRIRVQ